MSAHQNGSVMFHEVVIAHIVSMCSLTCHHLFTASNGKDKFVYIFFVRSVLTRLI